MPAPRQYILVPVTLIGVLLVTVLVSPPRLLTTYPPVYHDEYVLLAPSAALLEGQPLTLPLFQSTPALAAAFHGEGELTPGLGAGFHVALALWFKIFGTGIRQARAFVYCMGLVVLVGVFYLGTRWGSLWVGLTAALLLTLDSNFWYASRQVRPESFTDATYLIAACLLSLRTERWRQWIPEVAGGVAAVGICGHPVGIAMAPIVASVPFFHEGKSARVRYLLRALWPTLLVLIPYVVFLMWHWQGVQENLALNTLHRHIHPLTFTERIVKEWERYGGAYGNVYSLAVGMLLKKVCAMLWGLLAVVVCVRALGKSGIGRSVEPGLVLFAGAPLLVILIMAILGRDNNFLYLTHFFIWLYLGAAAGARVAARVLLSRGRAALRVVTGLTGCGLVSLLGVTGVHYYSKDLGPYVQHRVMPYEEIEKLLAAHLIAGAFVIANENAWLAVKAADAEFVFNKQYVQILPRYEHYPVRAVHEGSHLVDYGLDIELLRELQRRGIEIFYITDMWDWAWNLYAPFGRRYSESYLRLKQQLEEFFVPVLRIYTRDRGLVSLYRFGPHAPEGVSNSILYLEGVPHRVGGAVPDDLGLQTKAEVRVPTGGGIIPVAQYQVKPGRPYLLTSALRVVEGSTVVLAWDGRSQVGVDARNAVPIEHVVYANGRGGTLGLFPYTEGALAELTGVQLRELTPAP